MGCFHSKKEISELYPNVYRVVNVDESGADLCDGHLQITDTDIILYRHGKIITVWPLHSLRRYGFEGELFSFESGRRCITGEGIYAFRSRRASLLFRTLQQQIQLRNIVHESVPYPVPGLSPLPQGRQTLQASVVHRSSVDNGQPDNLGQVLNLNHPTMSHSGINRCVNQSPRSASSTDILEVMPLYPQSRNTQVTNVYQLRDFKREHNNNQPETITESQHEYTNDFSRDLAALRNSLKRETALNTMRDIEYETRFLESRCIKDDNCNQHGSNPISPALSSSSEHYAQLSIDQQDGSRPYVNIVSHEPNLQEATKSEPAPTTPLTPKQVEYCNLASSTSNKTSEVNGYANLLMSDKVDSVKSMLLNSSEQNHKFSESDTLTSMSPVEELEVNYAVLDIDSNKDAAKANRDISSPENLSYNSSKNESSTSFTSQKRSRLISQNSTEKVPTTSSPAAAPSVSIGYTTIDFDKTVALTSVAAFTDAILDGPRKTRHNSSGILCGSPIGAEKSRIN